MRRRGWLIWLVPLVVGCAKVKNAPGPVSTRLVTAAQSFPASLPTGSDYADMTFDLSSLGGELKGASFTVTVQSYTDPSSSAPSYRFKEPRLVSPTNSLHVADIRLVLNGQESATATAYEEVDNVVTPPDQPLLSSLTATVPVGASGTVTLAVSFATLAKSDPLACKNVSTFETNVLGASSTPDTMAHNCFGCHANPGGEANQLFDMSPTSVADHASFCAKVLQRVMRKKPTDSPVLFNPANGFNDMPIVAGNYAAWLAWIQSELQ